jgi:hypothetical protein
MPYRGVTDRHRLAIQPDLLSETPRHSRLRIGKTDTLGSDSAPSTVEPSQAVSQCHPVRTPRQVVPCSQLCITNSPCRSVTAAASITLPAAAFNINPQPRELRLRPKPNLLDPIPIQIQDAAPRLAHSHKPSCDFTQPFPSPTKHRLDCAEVKLRLKRGVDLLSFVGLWDCIQCGEEPKRSSPNRMQRLKEFFDENGWLRLGFGYLW